MPTFLLCLLSAALTACAVVTDPAPIGLCEMDHPAQDLSALLPGVDAADPALLPKLCANPGKCLRALRARATLPTHCFHTLSWHARTSTNFSVVAPAPHNNNNCVQWLAAARAAGDFGWTARARVTERCVWRCDLSRAWRTVRSRV